MRWTTWTVALSFVSECESLTVKSLMAFVVIVDEQIDASSPTARLLDVGITSPNYTIFLTLIS